MPTKSTNWLEEAEKNEKLDFVLVGIGVTISIVILYLLLYDIQIFTRKYLKTNEDGRVVANLVAAQNNVAIKKSDAPVWSPTSKLHELQKNDQIFTDENSFATVTFSNNLSMELGENSLVVILEAENENTLGIEKGSFQFSFEQPTKLNLQIGQKKLTLDAQENSEVSINSTLNGSTELAAVKGVLKIETDQHGKVELGKNSKAQLSTFGSSVQINPLNIQLLSPLSGLKISKSSLSTHDFRWQLKTAEKQVTLEVASDINFKNIVLSKDVEKEITSLKRLEAGTYFWRVRSKESHNKSLSHKFTVTDNKPPVLFNPSDDKKFYLSRKLAQSKIDIYLDWAKVVSTSYQIEVSSEANFGTLIFSEKTSTPPLLVKDLPLGKYYWRVRLSHRESSWSQIRRFEVLSEELLAPKQKTKPKKIKAPLAPPKLEIEYRIKKTQPKKEHGSIFDYLWPKAYASEVAIEAEIKWQGVEGATSYDVQIGKDKSFTPPLQETNVKTPSILINNLPPGTYFLRIRTVGDTGQKSAFSEPSTIYIAKPAPRLTLPVDGHNFLKTNRKQAIQFKWEGREEKVNYVFEVSTMRNFETKLIRISTKLVQTTRTFTRPGTFYWRVGVVSKETASTEYSPVSTFSITEKGVAPPKLSKSIIIQPLVKKVVNLPSESLKTKSSKPLQLDSQDSPLGLIIESSPSRLETLSDSPNGQQRLKLTTLKSMGIEFYKNMNQKWNLGLSTRGLESKILKSQSVVIKEWQAYINRFFQFQTAGAMSRIGAKLSINEKYLVGLLRFSTDQTRIFNKKMRGFGLGVDYRLALHRNLRAQIEIDYIRGLNKEISGTPSNIVTEWSFIRNLTDHFEVGIGYRYDLSRIKFETEDSDHSIEKITSRKQSILFKTGYLH